MGVSSSIEDSIIFLVLFVSNEAQFFFPSIYVSRIALLAGGDVLALLLFAAIGRFSHGFPVFDIETLRTADPFIAGNV